MRAVPMSFEEFERREKGNLRSALEHELTVCLPNQLRESKRVIQVIGQGGQKIRHRTIVAQDESAILRRMDEIREELDNLNCVIVEYYRRELDICRKGGVSLVG